METPRLLHLLPEELPTENGARWLTRSTECVPGLITAAGEPAQRRFVEFFTARIRNPGTRAVYARAVRRFCNWCELRGLALSHVSPFLVAAYIEELTQYRSAPTVKLHLAAIRMLCDYLVTGQVLPVNPAAPVRGPRHVVKKGKTPVLTAEEARQLLDSIDCATTVGLRDRALIAVMVYSFARVSAAIGMNVEDYFPQGRRMWFRLHEKGGKHHEVPAHQKAETHCPRKDGLSGCWNRPHNRAPSALESGGMDSLEAYNCSSRRRTMHDTGKRSVPPRPHTGNQDSFR